MIVVALTSWKGRISNCEAIIKNILSGTIVPSIYLTLSVDEFPKKEDELPKGLVKLINSNNVNLHWVQANTKCMKKVFPILQYLEDDDIILPIDDDIMYPKDYIEKRVDEYKEHLQPITGFSNMNQSYLYKKSGIIGNLGGGALFTKKMLAHYDEYVNQEIIDSNNDDTVYAILQWLNGYIPQVCKYYDTLQIARLYTYNEIEPSGKLKRYVSKDQLVDLHSKRLKDITNCGYNESFNFYNKNELRHIFIPYIAEFSDDSSNDNKELKYAIKGINKFFTEKHIIHIISDKSFEINEPNVDLMILPKLDIANNISATRFADSNNRIKYAFETIGCDEAIIHWDDTYALNPYTYEDCKHSKWVDKDVKSYKRGNVWGDGVCNALDCIKTLRGSYSKNYCSHIPFVWKKDHFLKMITEFDYMKYPFNGDLAYFNIFKQSDEIFVPWRCSKTNPKKCIYKKEVRTESDLREGMGYAKWSTIDIPLINFNHFKVLDEIYGKDTTTTTIKKLLSNTKIEQIRKDIAEGKIIRVPNPNRGGFIWKRVK